MFAAGNFFLKIPSSCKSVIFFIILNLLGFILSNLVVKLATSWALATIASVHCDNILSAISATNFYRYKFRLHWQ